MAAYAALLSLMNLIHDIQNHHSPPISLDKQQVESLTQKLTFLLEFLESYTSPLADINDEADPLEIRIADAAYAAEDVIESYIVDLIKLSRSRSTHGEEIKSTFSGENDDSSEENDDSGEEIKSTFSGENDDSGDEKDDSGEENDAVKKRMIPVKERMIPVKKGMFPVKKRMIHVKKRMIHVKKIMIPVKKGMIHVKKMKKMMIQLMKMMIPVENYYSGEENDDSGEEVKCREELSCINLYEDLHQVIEEMDLIKKVAVKIDAEKVPTSSASSSLSFSVSSFLSSSASTSMVCSDDILHGIMEKLVGKGDRQAIPITGMGGIGKTTLARNLYAQPLINEYFDVCVWATISQKYNKKEILCELLSRKGDQSERSVDELGSDLYKYLFGRRFLIVLDDMWSIDVWEEIQRFFPNNENGSWILVTTRLTQLSSQLNKNYSLQMQFLDEVSSWDLFSKTVFEEETCPHELEGIGKKIVKNCRGLPLSIVVVGGLLKKLERTPGCWELIRNNLTSLVSLENDKHCLRLLKVSYDHLPLYLKPCFLYMGVFEEDCKIWSERLIMLWISEGFLKPIDGKSLETITRGFLEELVDRNLILIDENGYHKIHDLVRDLCLRESKKYGFYHVIGGEGGSPQGINSQRRVVILRGASEEEVSDVLQSISHTRSVICEKKEVPLCENFALVRTIDVSEFSGLQSNTNGHVFESCVNLRHLVVGVGVGSMSLLLSSLNVFWNLQTLIVQYQDWCDAPIGIWKMPQLRHIEFKGKHMCLSDPPPSEGKDDVVVMENLEIIEGVKNLKFGEEVVRRIPNVKKLRITLDGGDDEFVGNIKYLCKLESLYVWCDDKFASLHKLTFPHSLKTLTLRAWNCEFEWEKMLERIGSLPLLERLLLWDGCFKRGKWEIGEDQFPCLKYLNLYYCGGLKEWTMAQESCSIFPRLEYLDLRGLEELEEIPREIGDISTLQKITLFFCSESAVRSSKEIVEEQMEYQGQHLPFHVQVRVDSEELQSLAGPNFVVNVIRRN